MLYFRVSQSRAFFISEYWIFISLMLMVDYEIMGRMRQRKIRKKALKELKNLNQECRLAILAASALSDFIVVTLGNKIWGVSDDLVDVSYLDCDMEKGCRFVDNDRIRKLVIALYSRKKRKNIISVAATALCHLAKSY